MKTFLVCAAVILGILLGLSTIPNSSTPTPGITLNDGGAPYPKGY